MLRHLLTLSCPMAVVVSSCSVAFCLKTTPPLQYAPVTYKDRSRFSANAFVRCGRAAWTVIQISYDYKKTLMEIDKNKEENGQLMSKVHLRSAMKLRDLCSINGGVYIKGAQYIGALDYLLPTEYVQTMKVFHSDAPRSTLEDINSVILEDLGKSSQELFASFDLTPIGCASLAQVHKATLLDGRTVAVKVQHRDVQEHVTVDIYTIEFLAKAVAWAFPEFKFKWLVDETKRNLPLELDFKREGQNAEKVATLLSNCSFLKVPQVLWDWTSGRVLVMEFCEGGKVDDLSYMKEHSIPSDEVSRKIGELYSEMIFVTGYVHCDPHPGNVLVRKDDSGGSVEIVLLDHGLYNQLTDDFRVRYCKLWQSLIASDVEGIKRYSTEMGVGDLYGLFACMLTARAWSAVTAGIDQGPITDDEAEEIRNGVTEYVTHISDLLERVPRQLLLILKTNDLLRSIDHQLKTSAAAQSFITMSHCCIRAVTRQRLEECRSWQCRLRAHLDSMMGHCRVTLYQLSLSNFARTFRYLFSFF